MSVSYLSVCLFSTLKASTAIGPNRKDEGSGCTAVAALFTGDDKIYVVRDSS